MATNVEKRLIAAFGLTAGSSGTAVAIMPELGIHLPAAAYWFLLTASVIAFSLGSLVTIHVAYRWLNKNWIHIWTPVRREIEPLIAWVRRSRWGYAVCTAAAILVVSISSLFVMQISQDLYCKDFDREQAIKRSVLLGSVLTDFHLILRSVQELQIDLDSQTAFDWLRLKQISRELSSTVGIITNQPVNIAYTDGDDSECEAKAMKVQPTSLDEYMAACMYLRNVRLVIASQREEIDHELSGDNGIEPRMYYCKDE